MTAGKVFVFDTNTFISAHLLNHSVSNRAFRKAVAEVAIASRATAIISGDRDLLGLNPFRGIPILSPGGFLNWPAN